MIFDRPRSFDRPSKKFHCFNFSIYSMASYKLLSIFLRPEVSKCPDDLSKAVFILRNCMETENLTKKDLFEFFNINKGKLKRRLWSELQGYTYETRAKTKYLSEKHEQLLAEKITSKTIAHESPSHGQVKTWVCCFISY